MKAEANLILPPPSDNGQLMLLVLAGVFHVANIWLTRAGREKGITYDLIYLPGVLGQKVPEGKDLGILHLIDRHEISGSQMRNLLPVALFCSMSASFMYKKFLSRKTLFPFYSLQPTC